VSDVPQPESIRAVRNLLTDILERTHDGEILSIFVAAETTSGNFIHARTEPENAFAMAAFIQQSAQDLTAEKFYEDEFELELDDEEDDDEEDD
jgi:hypothetical protein